MTVKAITALANATINAEAANDVEAVTEGLRLRCRPSHTLAAKAALVLDCNQILPVAISAGIYGVPSFKDLAGHVNAAVIGCYATAANKRFTGDVVAYNTRAAGGGCFRVDPDFAVDDDAFTLDMEVRLSNIVTIYEIANVYTVEAGDRAWKLTYNGNQTFTWTLYGAGGATRTLTIDCTAWPLLTNTWYDLRITYNLSGPIHAMEIRRPSDDARITASAVDTIALNKPAGLARPGLVIGGLFAYLEASGLYNAKNIVNPWLQRATYHRSYLGTGLAAIDARPTFYAATTAGDADGVSALATLDSGADGSTWDLSTLAADDETAFASALSGGGWELRYQIADSSSPSSWSDWMTWASLKTETDAAGRYLHLGLRATSDGYNEFYPLTWISADAALTGPGAPVISDFTRSLTTGAVTVAGVGANNTAEIYAISKLDTDDSIISEKVGERAGSGSVTLDFSSFVMDFFGLLAITLPVSIFCLEVTPEGMGSEPSNILGSSLGDSSAVMIEDVSITSGVLTFTVAGLTSEADSVYVFYFDDTTLAAQSFTGNGEHTWDDGFGSASYDFIGVPTNQYGQLLFLPILFSVTNTIGVPVLSALANDGTGTSITATITPPAAGTYDSISVYYRTVHATTWSDGGSYVGTPSVAGTHQITGLTNGTNYEVFAFAVAGTSSGQPSAVLSVKCTSSTAPVVEQIMDDIMADLATITTTNGYHQTVQKVERTGSPDALRITTPMIEARIQGEQNMDEEVNGSYGLSTRDLTVTLKLYLCDTTDPDEALSYLAADVDKALMADRHRGDLAQWTAITTIMRDYLDPDGGEITAEATITLVIRYQQRTLDPYETR